jgi:hypothetical protein
LTEEKRLLITKIRRGHTERGNKPVVEMWTDNPRLRFPELRLFDLSKLLTVGIDPNTLEEGKIRFCRFWATYTESERQTQRGTAYRDVVHLEEALPDDSDDVTELLREQLAILARIEQLLQATFAPREVKPRAAAAVPRAPATQTEPAVAASEPETVAELEAEDKPGAERSLLNEDMARRRFGQDAGPAIRNGLVDAASVNALTKQVHAGALSWRSALEQLQEQLIKAQAEER